MGKNEVNAWASCSHHVYITGGLHNIVSMCEKYVLLKVED